MPTPPTPTVVPVAGSNMPRHAAKRSLLPPALRPNAAAKLFNARKRGIVAASELSSPAQQAFLRRRRWAVAGARPNNVFGKLEIRNGILYRADWYELVELKSERVGFLEPGEARRHPRGLNMCIALFRDLRTGELFWVYAFHAPRRKVWPKTNHAAIRAALDYAQRCQRRGLPGFLIGDGNNGAIARMMRMAGLTVLAAHVVDAIGAVWVLQLGQGDHVDNDFSDHDVTVADAELRRPSWAPAAWSLPPLRGES